MSSRYEEALFDFAGGGRIAATDDERLLAELHAALGSRPVPRELVAMPTLKRDCRRSGWTTVWQVAAALLLVIGSGAFWTFNSPPSRNDSHLAWAPATVPATPGIGISGCNLSADMPVVPIEVADTYDGTVITWQASDPSEAAGTLAITCPAKAPVTIAEHVLTYFEGNAPATIILRVDTGLTDDGSSWTLETVDLTTGEVFRPLDATQLNAAVKPIYGGPFTLFAMADGSLIAVDPNAKVDTTIASDIDASALQTDGTGTISSTTLINGEPSTVISFVRPPSSGMVSFQKLRRAVESGLPGDFLVMNNESGRHQWVTLNTDDQIVDLALSHDGRFASVELAAPGTAVGANPTTSIAIFDLASGEQISSGSIFPMNAPRMVWTQDSSAVIYQNGYTVERLQAETGATNEEIFTSRMTIDALSSTPDGSRVWWTEWNMNAMVTGDQKVHIWNPQTGATDEIPGIDVGSASASSSLMSPFLVTRNIPTGSPDATFSVIDPLSGLTLDEYTLAFEPVNGEGYFGLPSVNLAPGFDQGSAIFAVNAEQYLAVHYRDGKPVSHITPPLGEARQAGSGYWPHLTRSGDHLVLMQDIDGQLQVLVLDFEQPSRWRTVEIPTGRQWSYYFTYISGNGRP